MGQYLSIITTWYQRHRKWLFFALALMTVGVMHGINMYHYPYVESDEGTYMYQAYAVGEDGTLSRYVYWYDHPPFGWIVIASWVELLGGDWNFFGSAYETGRTLMWLVHMVSAALVFFIGARITRSYELAFVAVLVFSLSPLATYFQRRVLLDNLMTLWVLGAFAVLFARRVKLRHIAMSGALFGFAVLTKVTSVMFGPVLLYMVVTGKYALHRGYRAALWLGISGSLVSLWLFYALIKTELFPAADGSRVSLIETLGYQSSRGSEFHFWEAQSSFRDNVVNWMVLDGTYIYILGVAIMAAMWLLLQKWEYRVIGMATLLYGFFLIRGGIVIGFYIVPLLPFAALSLALVLGQLTQAMARGWTGKAVVVLLWIGLIALSTTHYYPKIMKYLTVNETSNQMEAIRWIKENLPEEATMISDIYALTELQDPTFVNEKIFLNADWYFKVAKDPAIRFEKYRDDWRNFDYIFISHEMVYQASRQDMPIVSEALRNSEPVMRWDRNSSSFIDIQNLITTNGDWAALYSINNNTKTQLKYAWNLYRDTFIQSYGQVVDPQTGNTTSEGQSYAMLRAALMNDRDAFRGVWLWTQHQLQHRLDDMLISWLWRDGVQVESSNATDGDIDIALALIFGARMFDEPAYLEDAQKIIADIWRKTVVEINGTYYLLPSERTLAARDGGYLLNPSYFSPAHYRIFAEVDTERRAEWLKLAADTYVIMENIRRQNPGQVLPRDWYFVNERTGAVQSAFPYVTQGGDDFSYDAFRVLWRVGLDYEWYETAAARAYLAPIATLFTNEWERNQRFVDRYSVTGVPQSNTQNLAIGTGILVSLQIAGDPQIAAEVYNAQFADAIIIDEEKEYAYWGNAEVYYDANWTWFNLGLVNGNLPNLWRDY